MTKTKMQFFSHKLLLVGFMTVSILGIAASCSFCRTYLQLKLTLMRIRMIGSTFYQDIEMDLGICLDCSGFSYNVFVQKRSKNSTRWIGFNLTKCNTTVSGNQIQIFFGTGNSYIR